MGGDGLCLKQRCDLHHDYVKPFLEKNGVMGMRTGILEALDGVSYVADDSGRIINFGRRNWNSFAADNNGPDLCDASAFLGRNILDFITGEDVRTAYDRFMKTLLNGRRKRIVFGFTCDAPQIHRDMRMAITVIAPQNAPPAFLFQSIVLHSSERAPIPLFDFRGLLEAAAGSREDLPFLGMYSYCQMVRFPAGSTEETGVWLPSEDYYRRGGKVPVQISHGICPSCYETKVRTQLE